jgi:predicted signal transduction protein with EAL and GGDEF domain
MEVNTLAIIEAVLIYNSPRVGEKAGQIVIGKTDSSNAVRVLKDCIIAEAVNEAKMWESIDKGVATMCHADVQRLLNVLSILIPNEDIKL